MFQAEKESLKTLITESLEHQGFIVQGKHILPPGSADKERLRQLHNHSVTHKREKAKAGLARFEESLLTRLASVGEVNPNEIIPRLVQVQRGTQDELLFRYACLHWSIPVSSGYGRRMRFLVIDEHNNKLIGVFGLGDPVFSLGDRDRWVGWDNKARENNLRNVMDAFALGAVPPYSFLLCGKLIAMLVVSNEVQTAFKNKYGGKKSLIQQKNADARLALITTTSALGRSSIYNRIRYHNQTLYHRVGFTKWSGEFHFTNGLYATLLSFAERRLAGQQKASASPLEGGRIVGFGEEKSQASASDGSGEGDCRDAP